MATTAGSASNSRVHRAWALVLLAGVAAACGDSDSSMPMMMMDESGFDQAAMLENLGTNIIAPAHADFVVAAADLRSKVETWQGGLGSPSVDQALTDARASWRTAMSTWSRVELMQVGPAAPSNQPGGEAMRDEIYSWDTISACAVDQQVVSQSYAQPGFAEEQLVNTYGLDALEYLLFFEGSENQCASASSINRDGLWDAIPADEVPVRRAAYALVVAQALEAQAQVLSDRWDPASGNFSAELRGSVSGESAVYADAAAALDAVYAGMFYVDVRVKDAKLGRTTGQWEPCSSEACGPEFVESPWAAHSLENVAANLRGLQLLYLGGEPGGSELGFDDFLRAREADALATQMEAAIADAVEQAANTPGPLVDTVANNPAEAVALYDAVKAVTDPLKTEFAIVLQVTIPMVGQGDLD